MTVQKLLNDWTTGDPHRALVTDLCEVTALSRYKIIGEPISGLYGKLKDEAFVLRLTLRTDPDDYKDVFVGNDAGPKLLGNENIPPCFNPLRAMQGGGGAVGTGGATRGGHRFTPYNQELYTVINLFFIALRMDQKRKAEPTATCLDKLSKYGDRDLTPFWAWKMNDIMGKYKSNLANINTRLHDMDDNARTFDFPLIRERLERDDKLTAEDILF